MGGGGPHGHYGNHHGGGWRGRRHCQRGDGECGVRGANRGCGPATVERAAPPQPPAAAPASPPTAAATHDGITCDACGAVPIVGTRFKCAVCDDYDLCGDCHNINFNFTSTPSTWGSVHDASHPFLALVHAGQAPEAILTVLRGEGADGYGGGMPSWRGRRLLRAWLGDRLKGQQSQQQTCGPQGRAGDCGGGGNASHCQRGASNAGCCSFPGAPEANVQRASSVTAAAAAEAAVAAEEDRVLELAIQESLGAVAAAAADAAAPAAAVVPPAMASAAQQQQRSSTSRSAKFIASLTQEGSASSVVGPGAIVVKAWRIKNEGAEAWPEGARVPHAARS